MNKHAYLVTLALLSLGAIAEAVDDLKLNYTHPARSWMEEALPVGNGYMGAMTYGGVLTDEIQLSEESIWAGGPSKHTDYQFGNRKGSYVMLPEVRRLLREGDIPAAEKLVQAHFTGTINSCPDSGDFGDYGAQQPFGSLFVSPILTDSAYTNYHRSLDLSRAVGVAAYTRGGIDFSQEYFASYPARLVVAAYENNAPQGVDYRIDFKSPHKNLVCKLKDDVLTIEGRHVGNDLYIAGQVLIKTDGRIRRQKSGEVTVIGARYVELYASIATDYKNEYPHYRGGDWKATNKQAIATARATSREELRAKHEADYRALFDRVSLHVGQSSDAVRSMPTDERLYRLSQGGYDPELESLYFQYGRYLLISSSRPGTMPAHLQGKWNDKMAPPWACDYHMNINLQMIYWPAEVTNLAECHEPLMDYINSLREPGRVTAQEYFGARGWAVNTMNNAYGYTAPGWDFNWGYAPNSAAWLCRHIWDHYRFTGDKAFLRDSGYPVMKEVGQFWLDYLTTDSDSTLVSSPSYSPEHGLVAIGATIDQEIAWDLFANLLAAGKEIPGEEAFLDSIADAQRRLSSLKIGRYGQLQEWKEDLDDPANRHRHVSHLYAVYPGNQISPATTPELNEAAKRSLVYRGEDGTGWSLGWKINLWARFLDGNQSYKMIRNLLTPAVGKGSRPSHSGSYSNLLCAHPPFQIDGNMGAVSGMTEMLLQSHDGTIRLLPALPVAWPKGNVKGIRAAGGAEIAMSWSEGMLTEATVSSQTGGTYRIAYKDNEQRVTLSPGECVTLTF